MSLKLINLFIELYVQKMWKLWDRKHYKDFKELFNYMAVKKIFLSLIVHKLSFLYENGFVFLISQKGSWSLGSDITNGDMQTQHGKSHAESNVPWSLSPACFDFFI